MQESERPDEVLDHEAHARRHRGGVFFEKLGIDLFPHPYLGFALPPGHRSASLNTDEQGFRLSASPRGTVTSRSWLAGGGGGLILGSSVAFGLAASSDDTTLASQLAARTGEPWLNLAVLAANSLQELVAAVPYLHAASTVVVFSGMSNYLGTLRTHTPYDSVFGPVFYEGTFAKLTRVPLFDLAALAAGEPAPLPPPADAPEPRDTGDGPDDAAERVTRAATLQLRDLTFLARSAEPGTRVVFCLQPLATSRTRAVQPEEQADYDFGASVHGVPNEVLEAHLDRYAGLLADGCDALGVDFVDASADRFTGRSFVTNGVLTDHGTSQVAELVHGLLTRD